MIKYVVKLVSLSSKSGKTTVGTRLVDYLRRKGYNVGVIKHCHKDIILDIKDSSRYLEVGADEVLASSKDLVVMYKRSLVDDLKKVLDYINTPIVVVEGYRGSDIGDNVGIVRDVNDFRELLRTLPKKLDAIVSNDDEVLNEALSNGIKTFRFNEVELLGMWVERRALENILGSLPRKDCGLCGYSSCEVFAQAYLKGVNVRCVHTQQSVRLLVNDYEIMLNPFVSNLIASLVNGLVNTLKGIPLRRDKIVIEVNNK